MTQVPITTHNHDNGLKTASLEELKPNMPQLMAQASLAPTIGLPVAQRSLIACKKSNMALVTRNQSEIKRAY